jgi:hypothetical protein
MGKRFSESRYWNPEKNPCFPPTYLSGDEYNQEEEKTALPTGSNVL